jgi:hypothetical protein
MYFASKIRSDYLKAIPQPIIFLGYLGNWPGTGIFANLPGTELACQV